MQRRQLLGVARRVEATEVIDHNSISDARGRLKQPVIIFWDRSRLLRTRSIIAIRIPGSGHVMFGEKPDKSIRVARNYLRSL